MFDFFYNTICNNEEVVEKLKEYFKKFPEIGHSAINAAQYLVKTKNYDGFSKAVSNMQHLLKGTYPELADFYPLMTFAAAADLTVELNSQAGIPYDITIETIKDTNIWIHNFYTTKGRYGLAESSWLARHYAGNLFKLGRLQYEIIPYPNWSYVLENKRTGERITLSDDVDVSASGHITGSSGEKDCMFRSSFNNEYNAITGNIIDTEKGVIKQDVIRLPKDEWKLILKPGDLVQNVHIPQGEKLDYEMCLKSMEEAKRFFAEHFPDIKFFAQITSTWLLDVNLEHILPLESNIIKFMKLFEKVPVHSEVPMIFERVFGFGFDIKDLESAPENTSLQRNLKKYVLNGGQVYTTGGYIIL
jgi:hypothetical protein